MADLMSLIKQAGFRGSAAQTMYAIVMAESGGNSRAFNGNSSTGDQSYGLAQINMLGSMGPDRLRQFGLKSNDDLYDPLTNLKVAYALSGGGTNFSPWTTYTRGTYQQYMGQSGATVTQSAGATPLNGSAASTTLSSSDYQDALGSLSGLLQGVPELKAILQQAVSGGWAVTKFQQAVQQSKWYQTHNASARELVSLKYSDPAEYKTKVNNQRTQIENMASKLGLQLGPGRLEQIVQQSLIEGWDQQTLTNNLGRTFFNPKNPNQALNGDIGSAYDQMKAVYSDYGVPVNDATLRNNALRIAEGSVSLAAYTHNVIQAAKSMFPSISKQLDSGLTVKQIADPYAQTMANILEVDPNTLGVTDPLIKKALQGASTTTGGKTTFMSTPLWQFEQQLRSDPRWSKTQNARDTMSTALTQVGRDFGFSV